MKKRTVFILAPFVAAAIVISFTPKAPVCAEFKIPPQCVGAKTCECCHEAVFREIEESKMGRLFVKHPRTSTEALVCETCHGSGKNHAETEGAGFQGLIRFSKNSPLPVQDRNAACLKCHEKRNLLFWQGSVHEMRDIGCTACHKVHQNSSMVGPSRKLISSPTVTDTCKPCHQKAAMEQERYSRHPLREGKMQCTSCHNPHGTVGEDLLKANSKNELCFSCHSEFRGPVLFEHPPVQEDCGNCHNSHGSNYPRLLKLPELRLCRACHISIHQVNTGSARNLNHAVGRLCTDCHLNVHGSNHPSGYYFTR